MEIDDYVDKCVNELMDIQDKNLEKYDLGGGRWNIDLKTGTIIFTQENRVVTGEIQVIGTLNHEKNTFMWAWEHPSIPKDLSQDSVLVKKWGTANDLPLFIHNPVKCNETLAWEFTAIARNLAKADGAYIGRVPKKSIFVTMKNLTIKDNTL
jgi:hypothetical protein